MMRIRVATKWWCTAGVAVVAWLSGGGPGATIASAHAQGANAEGGAYPQSAQSAPSAAGARTPQTFYLIVSGVSGEKRFADAFRGWTSALAAAAKTRFGAPDSMVSLLVEDSARVSTGAGAVVRPSGRSTRENVLRVLTSIASRAKAGDRVVIVLFGHGTTQESSARLNVPGPDITDADFARALEPFRGVTVLFVNTASASGEFAKTLAAKDRIIVTATKSAREQNETYFPQYFMQALTSESGDADKDGRVSVLEAFTFARREVERLFEQGNRIATEHAMLEDDGDGVPHGDASDKGPDGLRARSFFLEPLGGAVASADPRAAELVAARRVLEARIDSLRARRSSLSEDAYQQALEPLLLELAEKTRALRALEIKKP